MVIQSRTMTLESMAECIRILGLLAGPRIISQLFIDGPSYRTKLARRLDIDSRSLEKAIPVLVELKLLQITKHDNKRITEMYQLTPLGKRIGAQLMENRERIASILEED